MRFVMRLGLRLAGRDARRAFVRQHDLAKFGEPCRPLNRCKAQPFLNHFSKTKPSAGAPPTVGVGNGSQEIDAMRSSARASGKRLLVVLSAWAAALTAPLATTAAPSSSATGAPVEQTVADSAASGALRAFRSEAELRRYLFAGGRQ